MLFRQVLMWAIACCLVNAKDVRPTMDDYEKQKPISVDTVKSGDFSAKLSTYEVTDPARYGCGGMMKKKQTRYQLASLKSVLKDFSETGDLMRAKIKEQIFKLEPDRTMMSQRVDPAVMQRMREGCDLEGNDTEAQEYGVEDDSGYIKVTPVKEYSKVQYYKHNKVWSVHQIRGKCHMPADVREAILLPGEEFAVEIAGYRVHDDGADGAVTMYLKNKLKQLPYPLPSAAGESTEHMFKDELQIGLIFLAVGSVVGGTVYGVIRLLRWRSKRNYSSLPEKA